MFSALTKQFKKMTISRRITLLVLTAVIIVMSLFSLIRAKMMIDTVRQDLASKSKSIAELGSLSIADPLWNFHIEGISAVGDALFKDPEIASIRVRDIGGDIVYDKKRSGPEYATEKQFSLQKEILRNNIPIGMISISLTTAQRDALIRQDLLASVSSNLFLVLILWAMINFISRLVTKPIYELSEGTDEITRGNLTKRLTLDYDDEIGRLGQKFNIMAEHLEAKLLELSEKNQALEQEMAKRLLAQAALASSEEKFAKAFRYSSDAVGIIALQQQSFIEVSDAFYNIFGYTREQVIGHSSDEFALWENSAQRDVAYELLERDRTFSNLEIAWRTREGNSRTGLCSAEVIEINHSPHIVFVWHDISDRKHAEAALLEAHNQLEQKVEERTQELTAVNQELRATNEELSSTLALLKAMQQQLIESEKMVALGNLVAGVAHEINTPVGVSVTAASHLLDLVEDLRRSSTNGKLTRSALSDFIENAAETSRMILNNLDRAANLVRSFKQVSVDQSREIRRSFKLNSYLEDVIRSLHAELKKTKHKVTINCPEEISIDSYPGAFAQIATNLVMNSLAHAYAPEDAGQLRFDLLKQDDRIIISYCDDGKGIPKEVLGKIFEPFFTTRRGEGSTGLGLHILYNIVTQQLQGQVECQSQPGQGVRFIINIPATLS